MPDVVEEEERDPTKRTILQTSRLFVRNLAFSCTEEELKELFSSVGEVSKVNVISRRALKDAIYI